jgi:hypothetical protein
MLAHELRQRDGILILRPGAPLEARDFAALAKGVDPYIEQNGKLHGIMVDAAAFPGWKDFDALLAHFKFVRNHHQKIEKIAVVSDSSFLSFAPRVASHFVKAEVKHFTEAQKDEALRWLIGSPR